MTLTAEQHAVMEDAIARTCASVAKMPPEIVPLLEPIPEMMEGLYRCWQDAENRAARARVVTEEMVDRAVEAFWAQDLYEHTAEETRDAMRDALKAALSACASPDDASS